MGKRRQPPSLPVGTLVLAGGLAAIECARIGPWHSTIMRLAPSVVDQPSKWWFSFTGPWVQALGTWQLVGNVALLLVVGPRAERRFGTRRLVAIFVGGGVATELIRVALTRTNAAGSSTAVLSVAGALLGDEWIRRGRSRAGVNAIAGATALAGAALAIVAKDGHTLALSLGLAVGGNRIQRSRDAASSGPRSSVTES